jgi:hypothetical protein
LQLFYEHRYAHPWEEIKALENIWLKHNIKSEREITGEHFYLYQKWLTNVLDNDDTKANFAIILAIIRKFNGFANIKNKTLKLLLQNVWLRAGKTDDSIKLKFFDLNKKEFQPCISTETYLHILQLLPLEILKAVSIESFRGKNAYILDSVNGVNNVNNVNNVNEELPHPGEDLLHKFIQNSQRVK